ncbi:MAG TPA: hypothetical protein VF865_20535 [Acidobacteriaceae bacterium]
MTIVPGRGTERLHLGQTSSDLRSAFGPPGRRRKDGSFREYWVYPDLGFECIVSRRTGRILSIFFHRAASFDGSDLFGASEERIRTLYSPPSFKGGGFRVGEDKFFGRWYSYESGIGFHFDESGHVKTISVFVPKRRRKAQTTRSDRRVDSRGIAALRRA